MSVVPVQPTLGVPVMHPKPDAKGQSSRDPRRDGKPMRSEHEQQDQPDAFLNALGELTGKTINTTA